MEVAEKMHMHMVRVDLYALKPAKRHSICFQVAHDTQPPERTHLGSSETLRFGEMT